MRRVPASWLLATALVAADDVSPPAWRGEAGSSFRSWEFAANGTNSAPDSSTVTGDTALAVVVPEPVLATGWYDTVPDGGSQQGFWDIARGRISLSIPVATAVVELEVRIQTTWLEGINAVPAISIPGGTRISAADVLVEEVPPLDRWKSRVETWSIASPTADLEVILNGNAVTGSQIDYISVDIRGTAAAGTPFGQWAGSRGLDGSAGKENGPADDPDRDGALNVLEFALGSDPLHGSVPVGGAVFRHADGFVYTIPVLEGAPEFTGATAATSSVDGIVYHVEGTSTLSGFTLPVISIPAVVDGLPVAPEGYSYRSFRFAGSQPQAGFMRLRVTTP